MQKPSQPSVVIPPRLLSRPTSQDINFFQDTTTPSAAQQSTRETDEPIDATLLEAVGNLSERRNVLSIEHTILTFVKSR